MDSATILVQWDEVPCLDQNSNITSYTVVRYEFGDQSSSVSITVTDRMASLTSLQLFTNYSIQVAAVNNNDDMGPLSTPITEHTPATSEFCCIHTHICMFILRYVCTKTLAVARHPTSTCIHTEMCYIDALKIIFLER